ncbi:hypothetical protein DITRI_Ditri01bG0155100 [Diplodiscus trichospermus]
MSDYFPVEVILEILKRLPVRSLVRCRIIDYKLLIAVVEKVETLREAYLFSLNENLVTATCPKYAVDDVKLSAFVNGAAHWVGYQRGNDGRYRYTILGFDVSTEELLVIGMPESLIDSFPMGLSIIKYEESSIALFKDLEDGLDVWVMKEYAVARLCVTCCEVKSCSVRS